MLRINEADKVHKYYKRGGVIKGGWKDKKEVVRVRQYIYLYVYKSIIMR